MSEQSPGTGRLFRSLRAEGASADVAVPALTLDQAVGLRTMTLGSGGDASASRQVVEPIPQPPVAQGSVVAEDLSLEYAEVAPRPDILESGARSSDDAAAGGPAARGIAGVGAVGDSAVGANASAASGRRAHAAPGVRSAGIWLVVLGVTVVMGFADALVIGQTQLGWLTGVSLLAASVYGALMVRRDDAIVAVIAPPLAFFLATITAGQLTLPPTGDLILREAFMIITTLGANAVWIFGSTIVALVIVLVRRRRSTSSTPSPQP